MIQNEGLWQEESTNYSEQSSHAMINPETEQYEHEVRRSSRHREIPKILTYPELGNPLVMIVNSLLQVVNMALADSLQNFTRQ